MSKAKTIFHDRSCIINKKLCVLSEQFNKLPGFVSDFLIYQLVNENEPSSGIKKIDLILRDHYFDSDEKEVVKRRVETNGRHTIIGQIHARFDQSTGYYWCYMPVLGDANIRIHADILNRYGDNLLLGSGLWGKMEVVYDPSFKIGKKQYPFFVNSFVPLQITDINVEHWISSRRSFSKTEWVDLLINTLGLNPECFSYEEKLLHLCRLVPFIQPSIHFIELGPTETAKTYTYRNLSPYSHVITGSSTTIATLFYNKVKKAIGLVGFKDVICFDEITTDNIKFSADMVNMLKDTLNSGKFSRDNIEFATDASVCFVGNIECDRDQKTVAGYRSHLFSGLPESMRQDRAFLDRITGCIPGWKFTKVASSNFSKDYGFMADYFSAILHDMRGRNYYSVIVDNISFDKMSQRNQKSISNITCGLLKLIHPNCIYDGISRSDLEECVDIARNLRGTVLEQLNKIAAKEFPLDSLVVSYKGKANEQAVESTG